MKRQIVFLAYLQGIETDGKQSLFSETRPFLAYLQGIETETVKCLHNFSVEFLAYLQGIETQAWSNIMRVDSCVSSLPTRD